MLYGNDTACYYALTFCVQVKMGDWHTNSWTNSPGNLSKLEVDVELKLPQVFRWKKNLPELNSREVI